MSPESGRCRRSNSTKLRSRVPALVAWLAIAFASADADADGAGRDQDREAIAEKRIEEMLEETPMRLTPAAGVDAEAGRFPQVRVPLDGDADDVEVAPNPPPAPAADPAPPPHDADQRRPDSLTD